MRGEKKSLESFYFYTHYQRCKIVTSMTCYNPLFPPSPSSRSFSPSRSFNSSILVLFDFVSFWFRASTIRKGSSIIWFPFNIIREWSSGIFSLTPLHVMGGSRKLFDCYVFILLTPISCYNFKVYSFLPNRFVFDLFTKFSFLFLWFLVLYLPKKKEMRNEKQQSRAWKKSHILF